MSRVRLVASLSLGLLLGVGCSFSSLLNDLEREYETTEEIVCACTTPLYVFACEGLLDGHLDFDQQCVVDALEIDKEASKETLNCRLDAQKAYNDCLKDELDCLDFDTYANNCLYARDDLELCPELPTAVQEELDKCG